MISQIYFFSSFKIQPSFLVDANLFCLRLLKTCSNSPAPPISLFSPLSFAHNSLYLLHARTRTQTRTHTHKTRTNTHKHVFTHTQTHTQSKSSLLSLVSLSLLSSISLSSKYAISLSFFLSLYQTLSRTDFVSVVFFRLQQF